MPLWCIARPTTPLAPGPGRAAAPRAALLALAVAAVAAVVGAGAPSAGAVPAVVAVDAPGGPEVRADVTCDGAGTDPQLPTPSQDALPPVPVEPQVPDLRPPAGLVEHVRSYQIEVVVDTEGSMHVREDITYDFGRPSGRRGIFRDLVLSQPCTSQWERVYPLRDVEVESPTGAPDRFTVEEVGTGTRIRVGDPDDDSVGGVHRYLVSYTLDGVVNPFPNHQELYWNVVGEGWSVPIYDVTTVVHVPGPVLAATCATGPFGSAQRCDAMVLGDGSVTYLQRQVMPSASLTVLVALPPGTTATPLHYQEQWSLARAFSATPATVGGSAGLAVALLGAVIALAFVVGRDRHLAGSPVDAAFAPAGAEGVPVPLLGDPGSPVEVVPPDGARPAQVAVLLHERVSARDVTATIVDLAVRGVVRIEQVGEGRDVDYRLVLLQRGHPGSLAYERLLVDNLFGASGTEVLLSDLEQRFASKLAACIDAVYDDAVARGWFPRRPDRTRLRWRLLGFLLFDVGVALTVVLAIFTHAALLGLPVVAAGAAVFVLAGRFPRRTPAGTGMFRRARGFRRFIEDSEAPRARWAEQRQIFSEYLPYAIAMGQADRWARTFAPLGAEAVAATSPAGVWFVGATGFDAISFTRATESFTSSVSSSLSSTPPSSGGSGFSGGGGGSSGGGGGGGGGGSW